MRAIGFVLMLAACGNDSLPAPTGTGDYTTPDGFDRTGCLTAGWDQLALAGSIWTLDENLTVNGPSAGIVRFDASTASAVAATYDGAAATTTIQNGHDLFWN